MGRVAIIVGHARQDTYCEALGEAYREGAASAGHKARLFVTSRMAFDPILRGAYESVQPLEPDLADAYDAIRGADHIVIVFPLWLGTLPAILKGFLERVLQPDLLEQHRQGRFTKPLKGRSARVVVTMATPGLVYRWWYRAHALKMLKRNILGFVGIAPVRTTVLGNVTGVHDEKRRAWLEEMKAMGRRLD
ncbi:NAD(P)H-dependent oxidoreductase [Hyphomicrobium sp.]|uniref:NAD(P)H-dependent oxidoreductase n=1 Tax=Hyphomicrobium sp. TaxID=82 RepID=UPI0025BD4184|nr:NAD(P)H-dependent oxidoreductase [Hyphomicrobium sp.]MCC7253859.1 NAD(P)H-dependent oxidoreductase [Hyphomicrobium sp.]